MEIESIDSLIDEYRALNRVRRSTLEERIKRAESTTPNSPVLPLYHKEIEELDKNYDFALNVNKSVEENESC